MKISAETVKHIGHLAKISLTEEEIQRLAGQMANVVSFADQLSELDIADVPPTTHAITMHNVMRDDVLTPSYSREKLLKNAPERDEACFLVPRVVE
jgi:aspartyl-tRNA(Asn)/glutamyl-tRNA(Gln) amidotransferase subunit C